VHADSARATASGSASDDDDDDDDDEDPRCGSYSWDKSESCCGS
jgi:hypothetical protein